MSTPNLNLPRVLRGLVLAIGGTLAAVVVVLGALLAAAIAVFVVASGLRRNAGERPRARRRVAPARPAPNLGLMGLGPALARLRR